ncbi:MAG: hypothetical protein GX219_08875 [Tissierellia bacterium]|nr:hypothetical protein [Tissierellia bacterium]
MRRLKIILLVLFLMFISFETHASSGEIKFADDSSYEWNVKFNMAVSPETFEKDSVTVSDAIGNMVNVSIERGSDLNSIKIVPLTPYEYGRAYRITLHKNRVYSGTSVLKEDYDQWFISSPESTVKYSRELYETAVEGTGHGDFYYGAKAQFKEVLDSVYARMLRLPTESANIDVNLEKYNLSRELGDAIDRFIVGKSSYNLGVVNIISANQNPTNISFRYNFLKSSQERIISDLKGFLLAVYNDDGIFETSAFVPEYMRTNGPFEDNIGVPQTDHTYYYLYENIDITSSLLGLKSGTYTVKIKPSFHSLSDSATEYSDATEFEIFYGVDTPESLARFLPWFNLLELDNNPNITRYELAFSIGGEIRKFSFNVTELEKNNTTANDYTMRYYTNYNKKFLSLSRYDGIMNLLEENKGRAITLNVRGYGVNGNLLFISESPISINFVTKDLPKITAAYNLTSQQKYIVFTQNDPSKPQDFETIPAQKGEELAIETDCKDLVFIKLKESTPQFVPLYYIPDFIRDTRYATKKFEGSTEGNYGFYTSFLDRVNNSSNGKLLFEKVQPLTTFEKAYDGKTLRIINTNSLEDGEYILVAKDNNNLYYPLEKVIFNIYTNNFGLNINSISKYGIDFNGTGIKYEYRAYVLSEYDYFNFLNNPKEDFIIDLRSKGKLYSNPCSGVDSGSVGINLSFKAEPENGIYYLVLFNDRYRSGEVTEHTAKMFKYTR